jgi:hypothetical protein
MSTPVFAIPFDSALDLGEILDQAAAAQSPVEAPLPAEPAAVNTEDPLLLELLPRCPEALLEMRWHAIWDRYFSPAAATTCTGQPDLGAVFRHYMDQLPDGDEERALRLLGRDPLVIDFLRSQLPPITAGLFGARDLAPSTPETLVALRSEQAVAELLDRWATEGAEGTLPAHLRFSLRLTVPGLVCALADTYRDLPPNERDDSREFTRHLWQQSARLAPLAADFALRASPRGPRFRLDELVRRNPQVLLHHTRQTRQGLSAAGLDRVKRQVLGSPGDSQDYHTGVLHASFGSARDSNQPEHIWFGDAWGDYPVLQQMEAMDRAGSPGVSLGRQVDSRWVWREGVQAGAPYRA